LLEVLECRHDATSCQVDAGDSEAQNRRHSAEQVIFFVLTVANAIAAVPADWRTEWPRTDFANAAVPLHEIQSGGPPQDGIPSIDRPRFRIAAQHRGLDAQEPVIGLVVGVDARAYPLRILMWHEIVNDVVGGVPVAVTYCPLCNTSIVFDRRVDGRVLDFGTTGKLRHSDLVMYDRQTESWWSSTAATRSSAGWPASGWKCCRRASNRWRPSSSGRQTASCWCLTTPTRATMAPIPMSATTARPRLSCSGAGCRRAWPR
jgi:hypothetical protein